jgi:hypothetical protein
MYNICNGKVACSRHNNAFFPKTETMIIPTLAPYLESKQSRMQVTIAFLPKKKQLAPNDYNISINLYQSHFSKGKTLSSTRPREDHYFLHKMHFRR